jgi:hypothetical protein
VIKHLTDTYRFKDLLTYCKYIGSENLSEKTLAAFKSSGIYFYDKSGREIPLSQIPFEVREYESD